MVLLHDATQRAPRVQGGEELLRDTARAARCAGLPLLLVVLGWEELNDSNKVAVQPPGISPTSSSPTPTTKITAPKTSTAASHAPPPHPLRLCHHRDPRRHFTRSLPVSPLIEPSSLPPFSLPS